MTTPDLRDDTIFTVLRKDEARRFDWLWLFALALCGWVGAVAFIGRYRANQVARMFYAVAPREAIFYGSIAVAVMLVVVAALMRRRQLAGAAAMIAAFLAGHQLYALLYTWTGARSRFPLRAFDDGLQFSWTRILFAAGLAVPMIAVWLLVFARDRGAWPSLPFRIGDLTVRVRSSSKAPMQPIWRELVGGYGAVCLILFFVMQANVGFRPIVNGTLWPLLPAIVIAAIANALAEEVIFRGLVQPAFIRAGGIAAGLWMQGLLFGLMHWGVSVGMLAALPVSLLIGLGSVYWGKTVLDTGGLGWVIIAHAMIDVCVMSAFFVPRG